MGSASQGAPSLSRRAGTSSGPHDLVTSSLHKWLKTSSREIEMSATLSWLQDLPKSLLRLLRLDVFSLVNTEGKK